MLWCSSSKNGLALVILRCGVPSPRQTRRGCLRPLRKIAETVAAFGRASVPRGQRLTPHCLRRSAQSERLAGLSSRSAGLSVHRRSCVVRRLWRWHSGRTTCALPTSAALASTTLMIFGISKSAAWMQAAHCGLHVVPTRARGGSGLNLASAHSLFSRSLDPRQTG